MKDDLKFFSDSIFSIICLIVMIGIITLAGMAVLSFLTDTVGLSFKFIFIVAIIITVIAGWTNAARQSQREDPELYQRLRSRSQRK
ncbi:hypothetical protein E4T80_11470 [Muribacter muris]|uniref:Uncharacterized protein n=1 Tax=Muribacter muris TaxID=67855 RepID=A0A4Y9JST0_9PAST|nr:hypothetical protein [Muribacter muris]MBF0786082.1 hypothetical protein [Muribacter muris]MBF0826910.1 hypothetical protein [Muribacter muris]TFV07969.1 hypothetical protein E4T80_11470 [Muribacter muris]